jgi:deoxyribonuclease V
LVIDMADQGYPIPSRRTLRGMHVALDVFYGPTWTRGAAVGFGSVADERPAFVIAEEVAGSAEEYEPGNFKKRELPFLVTLVEACRARGPLATILVDSYVWLDGGRPGLGGHLYEVLDKAVPVIGVAKTRYRGAEAIEILRGQSKSPLLISAAGIEPSAAADFVRAMHGEHRIPTLLRAVDHASRQRVV